MSGLGRFVSALLGLMILGGVLQVLEPLFKLPPIIGFPLLVVLVVLGIGLIGAAFNEEEQPS